MRNAESFGDEGLGLATVTLMGRDVEAGLGVDAAAAASEPPRP
ncbi:MAG: hypothetical protein JWM47_3032 [Acidimicrobiales bacterium]|nr:hypothetical protein [Acidimicrobiales bacterium]